MASIKNYVKLRSTGHNLDIRSNGMVKRGKTEVRTAWGVAGVEALG